ncbi:PAS domain-containing sensor histidine kinase [Clostridium bowmanii]|uniref:sensor histidine kinase n=1 Tax=Clostridium bowmanii TaxID=132925 RepID=UPI001C0D4D4F|nr:PAS domain-containing sensor histidine kinase [Clostridium bowmanii]MBU3188059.1 PAS domain-containing sensor histidine kinase [Clostridium bowmanii]MCA1072240.1 PAS domain-containing sensor histidine kinase [Clostridium bowmanii]
MSTYFVKKSIIVILIIINIFCLNVKVSFAEETKKNNILIQNSQYIKVSNLTQCSIIGSSPSSFIKMSKKSLYLHITVILSFLILSNFIMVKNILKLRSAKKQSVKEKRILQAILDSTGDGILVVDKKGRKIHHNNKFQNMWGMSQEILDRNNNIEMIEYAKNQLINLVELAENIKEKSKLVESKIDFINFKDGRVFAVLVQPLLIENKPSGMVWNFRDITEKIQIKKLQEEVKIKETLLEEAKECENIKDQFFSTISHELKTPLNIILGVVQIIDKIFCEEKCCVNYEKLKKYMNISKQNCFRLVKLINNLIDINKIDSGFMHMKFKNYNIVSVVENITLSIAEYSESKGIGLIFDTEVEEKIASCDAEKLERVMLNLLSNAIKFTESGGSITVNIYDKGESILVSVKDTGIGVPSDMKEKIFDRFMQVDSTLSRRAEGSGIGLSLVKAIIELHNGTIKLESRLGLGSEFIIELPTLLGAEEPCVQDEIASYAQSNVERISIEFSDIYS